MKVLEAAVRIAGIGAVVLGPQALAQEIPTGEMPIEWEEVASELASPEDAGFAESAGGHEPASTLVGRVMGPDGTPAAGAVVLTSAGGQAVTGADGAFRLEVRLPLDAPSLNVTAVGAGSGNFAASVVVPAPPAGGRAQAGTLVLQQGASCHPGWLPTFGGQPGVSGDVLALAVFDDGSGPALYAGGAFFSAGGVLANHIARWDGDSWSPLGSGVSQATVVSALTVFDDGRGPALYAGGSFTTAGGTSASRVARWDGDSWSSLDSGVNERVLALAVFDDGGGPALYAGGLFTTAGGVSASRIAKWDGASWSALGGGVDADVFALAVFDDGRGPALYAGGFFTSAGGASANRIARWDGTSWSPLGSGMNGTVQALTVFDNGSGPALYVGGGFTDAGGAGASQIARWDGAAWSPLGSGIGGGGPGISVQALAVFDEGSGPALYAGGFFTTASGTSANRIARWDGDSWSALGSGVNELVYALAVFDDGGGPALHAGGRFDSAGGAVASHIGSWDGESWSALGRGMNGGVASLAAFDDGGGPALYAGGDFTTAGGVSANRIARWSGESWTPLGSGVSGVFAAVFALTVFDDGGGSALYAGGRFTTAGGVSANRIAKWDGASWSSLDSGMTGSGFVTVLALAVFDDGVGPGLYAGGDFTTAGGVSANRIAKWDGASWSPLGSGVSAGVFALTVFDDGGGSALYAGGNFATAGGVSANRIAKWDGASWFPLGGGISGTASAKVSALTTFDDGGGPALHAGGLFTMAGGVSALHIARWDGASWSPLGSGMTAPSLTECVRTLTVFDDGSGSALFAGGFFLHAGGLPDANRIAKWDGASWSSLGGQPSGTVTALAVFDDGGGPALYAGGDFRASPAEDSFMARWGGCVPELGTPFCSGDGTGAACPCGNSGASGHGCDNAASTGGVRLFASGEPATNSVVLHGEGFPPAGTPTAIVIRSTVPASAPPSFGDGLLCLQSPIVRMAASTAFGGVSWHALDHGAGPGLFHYQIWYRSTPASYCDPKLAFNTSNGLSIAWP